MSTRYQILAAGGVFDHQERAIVPPVKSNPAWVAYQEWLTAGGVPLAPDNIWQEELSEAKTKRTDEINAYAAGQRNQLISGRSPGEMASWAVKLLDALAVLQQQNSPYAPILADIATIAGLQTTPNSINAAMAEIRGITEAEYVQKVIVRSSPYIAAELVIDAIRGKHCDAIMAMTTVEEIITYNWRTDWPAIPQL